MTQEPRNTLKGSAGRYFGAEEPPAEPSKTEVIDETMQEAYRKLDNAGLKKVNEISYTSSAIAYPSGSTYPSDPTYPSVPTRHPLTQLETAQAVCAGVIAANEALKGK
jgi:hypothetical protein